MSAFTIALICFVVVTPILCLAWACCAMSGLCADAADLFEADILAAAYGVSPDSAPADRVKIDALKWIAGRRAPKRYGERVQQEITGADGGPLAIQAIEMVVVDPKA